MPCRPLVPGGRLNRYASSTLLLTLLGLMLKRVGRTSLLGVVQVSRATGLSRFWTRRGSPQICRVRMRVGPCLRSWAPLRVVCPSMDLWQRRASRSFYSSYPQANVLSSRRRRHRKTVDTSSKPQQKRKRDADGGEGNAAGTGESRQPKRTGASKASEAQGTAAAASCRPTSV